jgi:ribosomal protein S18 acetylase RimI-like enzyme
MAEADSQHQYIFDQTISEQREDYITNQLVAFNQAQSTALPIGQHRPLPLHLYALDQAGTVLGGLVGKTHALPLWFQISVLWVDEGMRHHGLGRQLMQQAEQEACQRGCRYARLATSNFQAPAFYEKLGYILYGTLENCPPGETVYYFWKELLPAQS